jgi:RNA polymerase sigma-70 factor (ECF subfamily)
MLLEKVRAGNVAAFETIYDEWAPELFSFACSLLGSRDQGWEAVQNVFIRIWEGRERWTVNGALRPYLFQAVRHEAFSFRRRSSALKRLFSSSEAADVPSSDSSPDDEAAHDELRSVLNAAIESLPLRRKTAYLLHRQHDMTYAEIAEVMGISPRTVENQMGAALKHVRGYVSKHYPYW